MVFYAHLLQKALESPTIVVLTDRNDLDDQLYNQFMKCKEFLRQEPIHAKNREHLKNWLDGRKANGIIFTTMQKFEESFECLSDRRNIIVMAHEVEDGATRPVYYESRVLKLNLDKEILELIDAEYDLMAQNADEEVIAKSKKDLGKMEAILGNEKK